MPTINEKYGAGNPAFAYTVPKENVKNISPIKSKEIIGIEIEVEQATFSENPSKIWIIKEDGSLRNGGLEFVTLPIQAEDAPAVLVNLFNVLDTKTASFNMRTSVHVHLNIGDLDLNQLKLLVAFYIIFERNLFDFIGKGRWKSIYCVPLQECREFDTWETTKFGGEGFWNKYTALNLRRATEIGTAEFRHMHGTCDVEKLSIWIGIICKLKAWVVSHKISDLQKIFYQLKNDDLVPLGREIFKEYFDILNIKEGEQLNYGLISSKTGFGKSSARITLEDKSPLYLALAKKPLTFVEA